MSDDIFHLYKLFKKSPMVSLSVEAIAEFYKESIEQIQNWIQEDIESGLIFTDEDRLNYYLTPGGFEKLYELNAQEWAL